MEVEKITIDGEEADLLQYAKKEEVEKVTANLQQAVNNALSQAKESGEFNGTSVTVSSVSESDADGGENVVTFSDGKTVVIKNGKTGAKGEPGLVWKGEYNEETGYYIDDVVSWKGSCYVATEDNGDTNPSSQPTENNGAWTLLVSKGVDGGDGADGKTPVKGTDYYTDADKAEMVNAVIAALPVYSGEVV